MLDVSFIKMLKNNSQINQHFKSNIPKVISLKCNIPKVIPQSNFEASQIQTRQIYQVAKSYFLIMTSKNFSIKETVHKNIQINQFPSFSNHRSLVGWCTMNYPKVLVNPIYLQKQQIASDQKYELQTLFQTKNPLQRTKNQFIKPFSNYVDKKHADKDDTEQKKQHSGAYIGNINTSSFSLSTTKHEAKGRIFEENNKKSEEFSAILPLKNILGPNRDGKYDRKIRQIGEVYYNPPNEGQQMRHLKKLPNTIIDEQNLLQVMDQKLEHLDLSYKNNISNDLINKIGYLAPNLKSLNLCSVPITNPVIIQLGKSCKHLTSINISLCNQLEQTSILSFLKDAKKLKKFNADHLQDAITDATLQALSKLKNIEAISVNFCKQITPTGLQFLCEHELQELGLSSIPNIKGEVLIKIFQKSAHKLKALNISFNNTKQINNALMSKLSLCTKIQTLILTGCQSISDQGITNLAKQADGYPNLKTLKVGGLINVSDQLFQLVKKCPNLEFLEANNLQRLSDHFLQQIKGLNHGSLRTIMINFTPNITDQKIQFVKSQLNKQGRKGVSIIRNINKMTDPTDDGLRMPIPLASMKIKKPKKKKK